MSLQTLQYVLTILGLSLSAFGAVIVLAADWSTMEEIFHKIGEKDPFLFRIPLIGYPFKSAKEFVYLSEVYDVLFKEEYMVDSTYDGFSIVQSLVEDIYDRDRWQKPYWIHHIEDLQFDKICIQEFPNPTEKGMAVDHTMYSNLYDDQGESNGWIRTEVLRRAAISRLDDLVSKSGAGLFAEGFILQLISELLVLPEYLRIEVPQVVLMVVVLFLVLSIPGLCEQTNT